MSLLRVEGLCAGYENGDVICDVDFAVAPLEIVAIAGTNGSGKSTLVKAIMGLLRHVRGSMRFDGHDLSVVPSERRVGIGMSYVPQVANVFSSLSVIENLQVVEEVADQRSRIAAMFDLFPALVERRRMRAGALSGGERQQLAFARALMSEPRLLVLDEPTAALAPGLAAQVFDLVQDLPAQGVSVLLVEQRARQALKVSDRGLILDQGRVVLDDTSRALLDDARMAELYLGGA